MAFNIRKFFEADAPVQTGGFASIAEAMARQGVKNETENVVATPINIPEKKEEPKAEEPTVAATADVSSGGEQVIPDTPSQPKVEEQIPQEPQKVAAEQVKQPTLQEVLKSQQPDAVFKALGFSDKEIGLLNELKGFDKVDYFANFVREWKANGNVNGYLKELTTDYGKMSAEDLMRHQLQAEYPKATPQQLEALYKKEVTKAYNLDSDDEDERSEGMSLLEAKADKYRDTFIENQKSRLLPELPEVEPAAPDPQEVFRQQEFERVTNEIKNNNYTRNIIQSGKIELGEGFSFPVDSNALLDIVINGDVTGELMFDKVTGTNGQPSYTPKVEHQILVAALQKYGKPFLDAYANHFKALGGKNVIEPIDNAKPTETSSTSAAEVQPTTVAGMMAKSGTFNSGGR